MIEPQEALELLRRTIKEYGGGEEYYCINALNSLEVALAIKDKRISKLAHTISDLRDEICKIRDDLDESQLKLLRVIKGVQHGEFD
jgi:uncharacterized coiled-coil protein SlyX